MDISYDEFAQMHYAKACEISRIKASTLINRRNLPRYIDKEDLISEAAVHGLEKAYNEWDPSRASIDTFLSVIIKNKQIDALKKKTIDYYSLDTEDENSCYEASVESMVKGIHVSAISDLSSKLHDTIQMLSEDEQIVLNFYLDDPRTYVARSANQLNCTEGNVRTIKCRAARNLGDLMKESREEYFDSYTLPRGLSGGMFDDMPIRRIHREKERPTQRKIIAPGINLENMVEQYSSLIKLFNE